MARAQSHDDKCAMPFPTFHGTATFYRAMHVVLARYFYRKSSVRPSVTLWYREHVGWTSSKFITRRIF